MKVAFYTLGCKVNQYESQVLSEALEGHGYEIAQSGENADIYVINSCTVTAESDRKTRQAIRRFKRNNPGSIVVLTGCLPQAFPEAALELLEADIVLGNRSNESLVSTLDEYFLCGQRQINIIPHEKGEAFSGGRITGFRTRTRANIKIEDGCNRFCSYCIIPYARGRVRSKPLDELRQELEGIARAGFVECVLVGINLSAYGSDIGKTICDAVELACSFEQIKRVRLGSLEPDHITNEVIECLSRQKKLCPQFHISLQSGCDATLKRMNRHYTASEYEALCANLRQSFEDATISTDVMVGFPGETQEEFESSLLFVKKMGIEKVHVFPYSPREGTGAASMELQITRAVKEERARKMALTAKEIRSEFLNRQVGKTVVVLIEEHSKDGTAHGYTANYTPVTITNPGRRSGLCFVLISGADGEKCMGEIINA
jgi:threonylcarbamoyladenosine tRNA methylthiotransferase MtaB